jgi:hypothetical protein
MTTAGLSEAVSAAGGNLKAMKPTSLFEFQASTSAASTWSRAAEQATSLPLHIVNE